MEAIMINVSGYKSSHLWFIIKDQASGGQHSLPEFRGSGEDLR